MGFTRRSGRGGSVIWGGSGGGRKGCGSGAGTAGKSNSVGCTGVAYAPRRPGGGSGAGGGKGNGGAPQAVSAGDISRGEGGAAGGGEGKGGDAGPSGAAMSDCLKMKLSKLCAGCPDEESGTDAESATGSGSAYPASGRGDSRGRLSPPP